MQSKIKQLEKVISDYKKIALTRQHKTIAKDTITSELKAYHIGEVDAFELCLNKIKEILK